MKSLILLFSLIFSLSLSAQSNGPIKMTSKKNSKYNVFIKTKKKIADIESSNILQVHPNKLLTSRKFIAGEILLQLNDTSMSFAPSLASWETKAIQYELPISEIETLGFRRKGSKGTGFAVGTLVGTLTGLIIGNTQDTGCSNTYNPFTGQRSSFCIEIVDPVAINAVSYGIVGGILGILLSSGKKKFNLSGNKKNYEKQRRKLEKLLLSN